MMNELAEIAIDSQVLQGKNVKIVELAGGSVCRKLTAELEATVIPDT
jgi:G3E family GTPase